MQQMGIRSVYLVTSAYHMPRANAIASVMLGTSGISFQCVSVPDAQERPPESTLRICRDFCRAVIWAITGLDFRWAIELLLPGRAQISRRLQLNQHVGAGAGAGPGGENKGEMPLRPAELWV